MLPILKKFNLLESDPQPKLLKLVSRVLCWSYKLVQQIFIIMTNIRSVATISEMSLNAEGGLDSIVISETSHNGGCTGEVGLLSGLLVAGNGQTQNRKLSNLLTRFMFTYR